MGADPYLVAAIATIVAGDVQDARADGTLGEAQRLLTTCLAESAGRQISAQSALAGCMGTLGLVDPALGTRLLTSLDIDRIADVFTTEARAHDRSAPHSPLLAGESRPDAATPQDRSSGASDLLPPRPIPDSARSSNRLLDPEEAGVRTTGRFVAPTTGTVTSLVGDGRGHGGIDIANALGTPIVAVADGEVISAGPAQGFGLWVRIKHADGTVTIYGHNQENLVAVGQRVRAGQQIAAVGNRGDSSGPHLHFEVETSSGEKIDPSAWLATRGASIANRQR